MQPNKQENGLKMSQIILGQQLNKQIRYQKKKSGKRKALFIRFFTVFSNREALKIEPE